MNIATLTQGFASLTWILFVGVLLLVIVRASRGKPLRSGTSLLIGFLALALVATAVGSGLVFIQPEERGVVISAVSPNGYRDQALGPGIHWVIPFAESVERYPISKQTYTMSIAPQEGAAEGDDSIAARTLDGQEIFVDASVIFAIDPVQLTSVHINWQNRYTDDLVRPLTRGIVRDVVSQYRVDEVISTKRFEMVNTASVEIARKLAENGIILDDFVLRNITFSQEYAASVEQKQIAEQQAQQAKFVVEQKKQEAEQARQIAQGKADAAVIASKGDAQARIIQAEAEKEALLMINEALRDNPSLLTYQYISKLAPNVQAMLLPGDSPFIFPLPTVSPATNGGASSLPTAAPTPLPTAEPTKTP